MRLGSHSDAAPGAWICQPSHVPALCRRGLALTLQWRKDPAVSKEVAMANETWTIVHEATGEMDENLPHADTTGELWGVVADSKAAAALHPDPDGVERVRFFAGGARGLWAVVYAWPGRSTVECVVETDDGGEYSDAEEFDVGSEAAAREALDLALRMVADELDDDDDDDDDAI